MKLVKFSLMNPDELDGIEKLQQELFRPTSFNQAKETAKRLLGNLKSMRKLSKGETAMLIRLRNLLRSNSIFNDFSEEEYLEDILNDDTPSRKIAISRLMKDTNKGISDIDDQITFPFDDGSKPTEKLAKLRLVNKGLDSNKFVLLPDAGPDRLMLDEKGRRLALAKELDSKAKVRSIDAITELNNVVIVWCMKYKGGTAAVGGSGQKDQGTTEGAHLSKIFEDCYQSNNPIMYKGKVVFFANLVYGGQFNDHKRIVENEMSFKSDRDCYRSFNISLDRTNDVIEYFGSEEFRIDHALEDLYNKYGYTIEFTGNPKPAEKARLLEWTTN